MSRLIVRTPPRLVGRLPTPDWIRDGETWRVEDEPNMEPIPPAFSGLCDEPTGGGTLCNGRAVARTRRGTLYLCAVHLREGRMWIENGRVVSWCLRP